MFKLALNAGHGFNTSGKRCLKSIDPNETREYVLNKRICDLIESELKGFEGLSVLRIDDGSELSISRRAKAANDFGAQLYVSIHHNAGIGGGSGGGIEVYTYLSVDNETKAWQSAFYDSLIEKTSLSGNRAQPLRSADFGELRETAMPAVLCECGFMDSTTDTPIILTDEFAQKAAKACVNAIAKQANLSLKAPVSEPESPAKKSIGEIADEVIKGLWGNGEERKASLAAAGYNYADVQSEVNRRLAPSSPKKTNSQIANEVIKGLWGNGDERKARLTAAGYDAGAIQKIVNTILK